MVTKKTKTPTKERARKKAGAYKRTSKTDRKLVEKLEPPDDDVVEEMESRRRVPWDPMPSESSRWYARFIAFRDLGPGRTLAMLSRESEIVLDKVQHMSAKFQWRERAKAWDAYVSNERDKSILDEVSKQSRDMTKRHTALAQSIMRLGAVELRRWIHEIGAHVDDPDLKRKPTLPVTVVRDLINDAIRLERLLQNQPEQLVAIMPIDDRRAILKMALNDPETLDAAQQLLERLPSEM